MNQPLWLSAADGMLSDLQRPGTLTLVAGDRADARSVLGALGATIGAEPVSVTRLVLAEPDVDSEAVLVARLEGHRLLYDVEAVCWSPWLMLDPVRLLQRLARRSGVVALWPGQISDRVASFSEPGRPDHIRAELRDVCVLRRVATKFPDEVPFILERIPA